MPYDLTQIRILRAPPERVYRALLDPAAIAKSNAPDGFIAVAHELDARVGARFGISFVNFSSGQAHSFGGVCLEPVPNEKIAATNRFEKPARRAAFACERCRPLPSWRLSRLACTT